MTAAKSGRGLSVQIVHDYETMPATGKRSVLHVVLPSRRPLLTPLTDLQDAGYAVVAVGVLPSDLPECPVADGYPGCEHLLLRRSR